MSWNEMQTFQCITREETKEVAGNLSKQRSQNKVVGLNTNTSLFTIDAYGLAA